MRTASSAILILIICLSVIADRHSDNRQIFDRLKDKGLLLKESYDTIVPYSGFDVHVIKNGNEIDHIGLNLFSEDFKEIGDKRIIDYLETTLLAEIINYDINGGQSLRFLKGDISDFRNIGPESQCHISNTNSRFLLIEWKLEHEKTLTVGISLSYDKILGGTRSEIEEELIKKIKGTNDNQRGKININRENCDSIGEIIVFLSRQTHINECINRNVYFTADSIQSPIWSTEHPVESISNLLIYPSDHYGINELELIIRKHDLGTQEIIMTNIDNLLAICESEGCIPYWGLEDFDGRKLVGSLFLSNWNLGYDHVLRIECIPEEIIAGRDNITAKASLYVPTNNIKNLIDDYE